VLYGILLPNRPQGPRQPAAGRFHHDQY